MLRISNTVQKVTEVVDAANLIGRYGVIQNFRLLRFDGRDLPGRAHGNSDQNSHDHQQCHDQPE